MCTDLRLVRLDGMHVSARTLDFAFELGSTVQVVPRGHEWTATAPAANGPALTWTNDLGFVALDGFGFHDVFADGLNEAGLSVGTLWLPETDLAHEPSAGEGAALDFANLAGWLLGTCSTVADVRAALASVRIWSSTLRDMWPADRPMPELAAKMVGASLTEHLAVHDAAGGDIVVEFTGGAANVYDNPAGVLTNSPTFPWHETNLRNYVGLTTVEDQPYNLMGMPVRPTGNGTGLRGLPGDVTPPSRFVRATVLTQATTSEPTPRAAVNQAFHCLDLVSVPRHVAASGDYTQWYAARDHDARVYYVRSYDGWTTDAHDLGQLGVASTGTRSQLPLPA